MGMVCEFGGKYTKVGERVMKHEMESNMILMVWWLQEGRATAGPDAESDGCRGWGHKGGSGKGKDGASSS